jgi:hypothetical protein
VENLKITLKLISPAVLSRNPFDGLLAKLFFEKQKNEGTFNDDYKQNLDFIQRDKSGFYHVSSPIFTVKGISNTNMYKSFDSREYEKISSKKKLPKVLKDQGSGIYKSHVIQMEQSEIEEVVFFVRGDTKVIVSLLENLRFLGKKSSLGFGEIDNITIKKVKEDQSVVSNGILMRPVPVGSEWIEKLNSQKDIAAKKYPLFHPYWSKEEEALMMVNIGEENGL